MDRYPLLFSEMLPRTNIFHFEIVCTWLKIHCPVLCVIFSLWRVQVWLYFRKKTESKKHSSHGGSCPYLETHQHINDIAFLWVSSHIRAKKSKLICMMHCCKRPFLFSVLWNQSAADLGCTAPLCLSSFSGCWQYSLFVWFSFCFACAALLLLSPTSASCDQGASLEKGKSS